MDSNTKKLFNIIFREAHVIDFDFSKWDKNISLVVVAGLYEENFFNGEDWAHQVFFEKVISIKWTSKMREEYFEYEGGHCQWVIMDFEVKKKSGIFNITLDSVSQTAPCLEIECHNVSIQEFHMSIVHGINPNWKKVHARPLARPSIIELEKTLNKK